MKVEGVATASQNAGHAHHRGMSWQKVWVLPDYQWAI
jgi:hypothetical protein